MITTHRSLLLCCLATLVVLTAAARAADVRSSIGADCEEYAGEPCRAWTEVTFRAGPGARNAVSVRQAGQRLILRDRGDRLRAALPCISLGVRIASCPVQMPTANGVGPVDWEAPTLSVKTGDGDDRLSVAPRRDAGWSEAWLGAGNDVGSLAGPGTLHGGPGDDRLRSPSNRAPQLFGEQGNDVLTGGASADELFGGPGDDDLRGDAGPDYLAPGDGADRVHGGPGDDTLSYVDQAAAIRVDLKTGQAWSASSQTRLWSVENVITGTGNDVLIGSNHPDTLNGGPGVNLIRAGGGDDTLTTPAPGSSCGKGRDTVIVPGDYSPPEALQAPLPADCERADFDDIVLIRARPHVSSRTVAIRVLAIAPSWENSQQLRWELRAGWTRGGPLLGRTRTHDTQHRAAIALNRRGRNCAARAACRASLTVSRPPLRSTPLPLTL